MRYLPAASASDVGTSTAGTNVHLKPSFARITFSYSMLVWLKLGEGVSQSDPLINVYIRDSTFESRQTLADYLVNKPNVYPPHTI